MIQIFYHFSVDKLKVLKFASRSFDAVVTNPGSDLFSVAWKLGEQGLAKTQTLNGWVTFKKYRETSCKPETQ